MKAFLSLLFFLAFTPSASAGRGELLSSRLKHHLSAEKATTIASTYGGVHPSYAVDVYEVIYQTIDGLGKEVKASGAVAVPLGAPPAPLVSIQHGTVFEKESVPSRLPDYWLGDGLVFAASGYLAVMPDYVGYGVSSKSFHPYLHARSLAASVIDLLRATRRLASTRKIAMDGKLFLVGYSEGGYATLATQREIEEHHAGEFDVTASAPMAGPYDLIVTMEVLMLRGSPGSVPYLAFAFWAYDRIYGFNRLRGIVREPYRSLIMRMFKGSASSYDLERLPPKAAELFEPVFLSAWQGAGAKQVKEAARANGLTGWKPLSPITFFHCSKDSIVPVENAVVARAAFLAQGAENVRMVERDLGDHGSCFAPLMTEAKTFFDSFRQGPR